MDYKQALKIITERRRKELEKAEFTYADLLKADAEFKKLDSDYRADVFDAAINRKEPSATYKNKIDTYLKALGLYGIIYPAPHCGACKDSGFNNGKLCKCVKTLSAQNSCTLPLRSFSEINYSVFDGEPPAPYIKSAEILKKISAKFPDTFIKNISLLGKAGTGKTFLMSCFAGDIAERGYSVMFITAFEFVERALKYHTTFDESKFSYLEPLIDCDLLIIDDLGTESLFKNVTVEYFFHVINERGIKNKYTAFTTNLTLDQLSARYGERTLSRLFDKRICFSCEFDFDDIRKINL